MWRALMWPIALCCLAAAAWAQEPAESKSPVDTPESPVQQYQAIDGEYQKAQQDFSKAYREAKTDAQRQEVISEKYPQAQKFAGRMLELAEKHPDDPAAVDALAWIVTRARTGAEADKALAILGRKHVESEKIGPVCQSLVYSPSPAAEKLLRDVMEKNPHHEVQGQACYALAKVLARQSERGANAGPAAPEAERLFERVVEKYQDVNRGATAKAAKGDLFEIRNLAVGKVAPEIEGEDMDSQPFKLSDYRGKVVVLDFWGDW